MKGGIALVDQVRPYLSILVALAITSTLLGGCTSAADHNQRGLSLQNRGDWDGALHEYQQAIRREPNFLPGHLNAGVVYMHNGDAEAATRENAEALRINPHSPLAHNNLGYILDQQGDLAGASREYREALRLDPSYVTPHYNLGWILDRQGQHEAAITEYREAIRLMPNHALARTKLDAALVKTEQAKKSLDEAMARRAAQEQSERFEAGLDGSDHDRPVGSVQSAGEIPGTPQQPAPDFIAQPFEGDGRPVSPEDPEFQSIKEQADEMVKERWQLAHSRYGEIASILCSYRTDASIPPPLDFGKYVKVTRCCEVWVSSKLLQRQLVTGRLARTKREWRYLPGSAEGAPTTLECGAAGAKDHFFYVIVGKEGTTPPFNTSSPQSFAPSQVAAVQPPPPQPVPAVEQWHPPEDSEPDSDMAGNDDEDEDEPQHEDPGDFTRAMLGAMAKGVEEGMRQSGPPGGHRPPGAGIEPSQNLDVGPGAHAATLGSSDYGRGSASPGSGDQQVARGRAGGTAQCTDMSGCVVAESDVPAKGLAVCEGKVLGRLTNQCGRDVICSYCFSDSSGRCHASTADGEISLRAGQVRHGENDGLWTCRAAPQFARITRRCTLPDDSHSCRSLNAHQ